MALAPPAGILAVSLLASYAAAADIDRDDPATAFSFEVGRIQKGKYEDAPLDGQMIQRTGVSLTQAVSVENRLRLVMSIGGLFWYATPETRDFHRHFPKFGPGVGEAQGILGLGNREDTWGTLSFGLIPFKYDADAKNLGEYLLRSGAYPNILVTGGWNVINSAGLTVQGALLEAETGNLRHQLLVYLERGFEPLYDLTPAYLATWTPNDKLEIGAGAAFAHLLSVKPSRTTPDGIDRYDPTGQPLGRYLHDTVVTDTSQRGYSNYTYQAIKLMARASLDLRRIFSVTGLGPQDLKLYSEAAILGVKDYPYYYDDIFARMPVMAGINLPTWKILDVLSLEVEYRKPEFANSARLSYEYASIPIPVIPAALPAAGQTAYAAALQAYDKNSLRREAWKWSLYAKRSLGPGLRVYAQAASDHFRGIDYQGYPVSRPLTRTPSDWYFLARIELGVGRP